MTHKAKGARYGGASPRERRNLLAVSPFLPASRRISARAEEPRGAIFFHGALRAHLRASGGTHSASYPVAIPGGASPRERRNQTAQSRAREARRRISARAEEPVVVMRVGQSRRAHLRASGGTVDGRYPCHVMRGASPRERRNP